MVLANTNLLKNINSYIHANGRFLFSSRGIVATQCRSTLTIPNNLPNAAEQKWPLTEKPSVFELIRAKMLKARETGSKMDISMQEAEAFKEECDQRKKK